MKSNPNCFLSSFFYIMLFSLILSGCSNKQEKNNFISRPEVFYKEYVLAVKDTAFTKLCISNKNKSSVSLIFQINDKWWFSEQQLVRSVLDLDAGYKIKADEKAYKAWIFTMLNSVHQPPFDLEQAEINNPLVFFNSDGRGYCYNRAVCLAKIWSYLGFQSRIVHLGGHAVPEVFEANTWKMFDPDNGIFFKDSSENIASVNEIAENPQGLIMDTGMALYSEQLINLLFNKEDFIKLFTSEENNVVDTSGIIERKTENTFLTIPPDARFEFPVCNPVADSFDHSHYCRLHIPGHFEGWVSFPFVIDHVEGDGFLVNSKKIIFPGNTEKPAAAGIYYLCGTDFYVYAFINPLISSLEKNNIVKIITGSNVPVSVFTEKTECYSSGENYIPEINKKLISYFDRYQALNSRAKFIEPLNIKSIQDFKDYVFLISQKIPSGKNNNTPGSNIDYLIRRTEKEGIDTAVFIQLLNNPAFANLLAAMVIELDQEQISQLYIDDMVFTLKKM